MSLFGDIAGEAVDGSMALQAEPIPAKTQLLAVIEEAKFDEYDGENFISITWSMLKPSDYAGRKVFQKLRVYDENVDKRKRQLKMLAAIDHNASGGELLKIGDPTDNDLARHLLGKQMVIQVMVWEMNGNSGNWISAVSAKTDKVPTSAPKSEDDDDFPF